MRLTHRANSPTSGRAEERRRLAAMPADMYPDDPALSRLWRQRTAAQDAWLTAAPESPERKRAEEAWLAIDAVYAPLRDAYLVLRARL